MSGPPGQPERVDIVAGLGGEIDSWNPYTIHDATSAGLLDLVYPRLFLEIGESDGRVRLEPWLAARWEFSADRRSLTFHLREDARWSDGSPVTCADVAFTFDVQRSPELAWPGAFLKERIVGVDCSDAHTAVFRFTEPYADQLIDANDDAIVPASYGDVRLDAWAHTRWETRAVTCGPFRVASVRAGQEAILERDPQWWAAGETQVNRLILRLYPDSSLAAARLWEGEVDFLAKVPPGAGDDLGSARVVELPSLSFTYLGWNTLAAGAYAADRRSRGCLEDSGCVETEADIRRLQHDRPHPVLADSRVRRALALAIDREDLVGGVWQGHARPGDTPVVSAQWANDGVSAPTFDPARAADLLEDAGWLRGADGIRRRNGMLLELEVLINADNRIRRDVLEHVRANLAGVGVRIVSRALPRREFATRARNKDFDVVLSGWWAGTRVEPYNFLHTRSATGRGNNLVSWSTAASDELLDRAARAATRAEAEPLWWEWQRLFREEQPLTVLYEERRLVGVGDRLDGPTPSFLNPFQNLHRWHARNHDHDEG